MTDETTTEAAQPDAEDSASTTRSRTRSRTSRSRGKGPSASPSEIPDEEGTTEGPSATSGDEGADAPAPDRRRTSRRRTSDASDASDASDGSNASAASATSDASELEADKAVASGAVETGAGEPPDGDAAEAPDAEASDDDEPGVIRRRRRRRGGRRGGRGRGARGSRDGAADSGDEDDGAEADVAAAEDEPSTRATRTRTRRAPSASTEAADREQDAADAATADTTAEADATAEVDATAEADATTKEGDTRTTSRRGQGTSKAARAKDAGKDSDKSGGASGSTRLQARNRSRSSGRGRGRGKGGRKPVGGVSEETRRAITEGPPRRMLVNAGAERTQIAVLEERTLVEHYVTRKEDVSYVGNIYLGRVQNVLPGMEAAFVDIGKGRNGVLYAGEVNYDEADLEGELPRIEDHLKPGQTVLVQVTKDPMGTKGARLTQHLSIAGRYCVLAPGDGMLGISRKLTDEERERLRKILKSIKPDGFGLIVRTAAEGATQEQLEADVSRLTRIWDQVQTKAKEVKALDPVYEEPHLVMRVIRDVFGTEFSDLIVDSEELAEQVRDYLSDVSPEMVDKVAVHSGDERIFDAYEVTNQVRRALEKKVWLRSGGYLIIEKTEAMWVIDVNTGKFVGKDNLEETVLKNNLEAADEIARQLRLRDMGGIIVIDFVDMLVPANRDEVLKRFKRELARDKTKSRVMDISKLGLVQMTRKNVSQGLTETFTTTCDACEGRGAKIIDEAFH